MYRSSLQYHDYPDLESVYAINKMINIRVAICNGDDDDDDDQQ